MHVAEHHRPTQFPKEDGVWSKRGGVAPNTAADGWRWSWWGLLPFSFGCWGGGIACSPRPAGTQTWSCCFSSGCCQTPPRQSWTLPLRSRTLLLQSQILPRRQIRPLLSCSRSQRRLCYSCLSHFQRRTPFLLLLLLLRGRLRCCHRIHLLRSCCRPPRLQRQAGGAGLPPVGLKVLEHPPRPPVLHRSRKRYLQMLTELWHSPDILQGKGMEISATRLGSSGSVGAWCAAAPLVF